MRTDYDALKIYNMNPKVTTKKLNRGIANKPTKDIYWNLRNYSVQKKAEKKKKGKNRCNKQKTRGQI